MRTYKIWNTNGGVYTIKAERMFVQGNTYVFSKEDKDGIIRDFSWLSVFTTSSISDITEESESE